ncbi:MAG: hypothetical protein IKI45_15695 [Oscillospiraceae bacterium]|nr:hypothetical protein [Oscillospiraceae bacterium]
MNFACRCGYVFHDNTDELSFKAHILADQDTNEFWNLFEDAEKPHTAKEQHRILGQVSGLLRKCIYQCPECGRLFLKDANGSLTMFTPSDTAEPEPEVNRHMLISSHGENWRGILYGEWHDPKPVWMEHAGSVGAVINPPEPAQSYDDFAETERQFHTMFEKLRAEDRIHYAAFHVYEQGGSRCIFSWNRPDTP